MSGPEMTREEAADLLETLKSNELRMADALMNYGVPCIENRNNINKWMRNSALLDMAIKALREPLNQELLAALKDLVERAERARGILARNSGGHWGMLDTRRATAIIGKLETTPETQQEQP